MDYNWLSNVPSSYSILPTYSPNFEFLQSMQMKANQQYEQGLSEVKNTYNAIFSQPVTGDKMTKRQMEYVNQAKAQLKDVSALDLSDPRNVTKAENIMTPFYKDPLYLKNIAYTKHYQKEIAKQEKLKNGTKEERDLWNPAVDNLLHYGLEQLADADLTEEDYNSIQKEYSMPIQDIGKVVADRFTQMFGVNGGPTSIDEVGNVIFKTKNGPQSVPGYTAFYRSIASSPEFAEQNKVLAKSSYVNTLREYKQKYPELPKSEIVKKVGERALVDLENAFKSGMTNYRATALDFRKKNGVYAPIDKVTGKIIGNPELPEDVLEKIKANELQAKYFESLSNELEKRYTNELGYNSAKGTIDYNSDAYLKTAYNIKERPLDYLTDVMVAQSANDWATGTASISSVSVDESPRYKARQDQIKNDFDMAYKTATLQATINKNEDKNNVDVFKALAKVGIIDPEVAKKLGVTTNSNGLMSIDFNKRGAGIESGTIRSNPGTDIAKLDDPSVTFAVQQGLRVRNANVLSFDTNGLVQLLSNNITTNGLEQADIIRLSDDLLNATSTGQYYKTPESKALREKAITILKQNGVDVVGGVNATPVNFREALSKFANNQSNTLTPTYQSANPEKAVLITKIQKNNQLIQHEMATYSKAQEEYNSNIEKFLKADTTGKYTRLFKTGKNGEREIITSKDIPRSIFKVQQSNLSNGLSDLPTYVEMYNDDTNKVEKVKTDDLIDGIFNNKYVKVNRGLATTFKFNGAHYKLGDQGEKYINSIENGLKNYLGGNIDAVLKKKKELESKVFSSIPSLYASTSAIEYDLSGKTKEEVNEEQRATGLGLLGEVIQPNNNKGVAYDSDGKKLDSALTNLQNRDYFTANVNNIGKVIVHQRGPRGVPSLEILPTPGTKNEPNPLGAKPIFIDMSESAKGNLISQIPQLKTTYTYDNVLKGEELKFNDFDVNTGAAYSIIPIKSSKNEMGNCTRASVFVKYWETKEDGTLMLDDNGNPKLKEEQREVSLMEGPRAISIDDLKRQLDSWQMATLEQRAILLANQKNLPKKGKLIKYSDYMGTQAQ